MKNQVINAFSQTGYIMLSKALVKNLKDLNTACVLSFMVDKWAYFKCNDFYYTIENLMQDTYLTERTLRNIIKQLISEKILIKKDFKGLPPKQYYNLNYEKLLEFLNTDLLSDENSNPCIFARDNSDIIKNDTFNTSKNATDNPCIFARDINNNKYNNNKLSNNKNDNKERDNKEVIMQNENENQKENTLSWKEKAVNLFDEYKITNFKKELWVKWIERKHKKHRETNLMSYEIDIQRLIRAKENANETLEVNIAGGWKTIYTKTEQKQTNNNRYKGTCNDHEVRANWHKGDSDKTARDIMAIIERDLGKFDDSPSVKNNSEELKNDEIYNNDNDLPF